MRDVGALEAALLRPQMGYYDGLVEEAAALMESLAMNHPFVDGNKRVAFFVTDAFLRWNGHFIDCDNDEAHGHFMGLFETNSFRLAELKTWLEAHARPLGGGPEKWPPRSTSRAYHLGLRPGVRRDFVRRPKTQRPGTRPGPLSKTGPLRWLYPCFRHSRGGGNPDPRRLPAGLGDGAFPSPESNSRVSPGFTLNHPSPASGRACRSSRFVRDTTRTPSVASISSTRLIDSVTCAETRPPDNPFRTSSSSLVKCSASSTPARFSPMSSTKCLMSRSRATSSSEYVLRLPILSGSMKPARSYFRSVCGCISSVFATTLIR